MKTIGLILLIAYMIGTWHLFPKGRNSLDVFKLNPVLFPNWCKFTGLAWIAFVFIYSIAEGNFNPSTNNFLLAGMYFGLLQIAFSREKNEDEFSAHIRIKAMYISIISLFIIIGCISSISLTVQDSLKDFSFQFVMMLFIAVLIVYLAYFYWTKYGFKRSRNEK